MSFDLFYFLNLITRTWCIVHLDFYLIIELFRLVSYNYDLVEHKFDYVIIVTLWYYNSDLPEHDFFVLCCGKKLPYNVERINLENQKLPKEF